MVKRFEFKDRIAKVKKVFLFTFDPSPANTVLRRLQPNLDTLKIMQFSQVVGQQEIKERLRRSVRTGRIPHAQMFFGPDGAGTLPLAIAYARFIACTSRTEDDSCGTCPSCRKFEKLAHPDLHFAFPVNTSKKISKDPVSDDYIQEWREFVLQNAYFRSAEWYNHIGLENKQGLISKRESDAIIRKLSLKSFESAYKIMIIWLPETMNATSSNVLLKLIEEPPEGTIFLLVSEDPERVLLTISSRTQPVKLAPLDQEEIREALQNRYSDSEGSLNVATRLSQGSLIRAMEAMQASEENNLYFDKFVEIMRLCYSRNYLGINQWVDETAALGRERLKSFFNYALSQIRENFIVHVNLPELVYMTEKEKEFSVRFHPYINGNNVMSLYREMGKASADIERNGYARIILFDLCLKIVKQIRSGTKS